MAKRQAHRLAMDVAEASRKTAGTTTKYNPNTLIGTVRRLEKLRAQRRVLRRRLKQLEEHIRHEQKMLKALAGASMGEEL
jgi:hypothetical protein